MLAFRYISAVSGNDDDDFMPSEGEDEFDVFYVSWGAFHPNPGQQGVLDWCCRLARSMHANYEFFLPILSSAPWVLEYFVADKLPQLGDSGDSKIYFFGKCIANLFKIGHTYCGRVRDGFYAAHQAGQYIALTVFNLDKQDIENHTKLVNNVLAFCREFCGFKPVDLLTWTVADAVNHETSTGLPFGLCFFLCCLGYTKEESYTNLDDAFGATCLGGSIAIKGFLRRLILHVLESGITIMLVNNGFGLNDASQAHEWLTGSLTWVVHAHTRCCAALDILWTKIQGIDTSESHNDPRVAGTGYSYLEAVLKCSLPFYAMQTWDPGLNDGIVVLTVVIMNIVFGPRNKYWWDAFGDNVPPELYNPDSFQDHHRLEARNTIYSFLDYVQAVICFCALDVNDAAFKGSGTTAEAQLDERGWKVLINFNIFQQFGYDIAVYFFQLQSGFWPSILFLHRPPCYMANTDLKTPLGEWMRNLNSYRKRAEEFHLLYLVGITLRATNLSSFATERDLSQYPLFGNILVAHCVFVWLVEKLHIGRMFAILPMKQLLTPITCNVFDKGNTNLRIINGNFHIVPARLREQIVKTGSPTFDRDRTYHITVLNVLALDRPEEAYDILRQQSSSGHYTRWQAAIVNKVSTISRMLSKRLVGAFESLHEYNQSLIDRSGSDIYIARKSNARLAIEAQNTIPVGVLPSTNAKGKPRFIVRLKLINGVGSTSVRQTKIGEYWYRTVEGLAAATLAINICRKYVADKKGIITTDNLSEHETILKKLVKDESPEHKEALKVMRETETPLT